MAFLEYVFPMGGFLTGLIRRVVSDILNCFCNFENFKIK